MIDADSAVTRDDVHLDTGSLFSSRDRVPTSTSKAASVPFTSAVLPSVESVARFGSITHFSTAICPIAVPMCDALDPLHDVFDRC